MLPESYASLKSNLRFKGAERLKADWSRALGLPGDQLCRELGLFDCIDTIHTVALGGVDAYHAGILEPLAETSLTAPMIVERVALNACRAALDRDLATPGAGVFWHGVPHQNGRLVDLDGPAVAEAIARLYRRILLREPAATEVAHLRQLYRDVVAANRAEAPAYDWAYLSCFAVLTSAESLFY